MKTLIKKGISFILLLAIIPLLVVQVEQICASEPNTAHVQSKSPVSVMVSRVKSKVTGLAFYKKAKES
tara:strand:+ start:166 stop:369 length:204 start_codon:yes stop_codon:yes gene_type:complete